eukprot:m.195295 g.195295  ORF g.195295 m.195295 type:complete len:784 (-) comp32559_c0_seq1:407-2758(-)
MQRLKRASVSSFGASQQQGQQDPYHEFLQIKSDRTNTGAAKSHRLNSIINRMSKTELHVRLPEILGFIFAFEGSHQDRMGFMSPRLKNAPLNTELLNLLHPRGVLMQKLMDFAYDTEELTYQFNKDDLPFRTQRSLNSSHPPNAFASFAMRPNMFEFYLMTFASAILKRSRAEKVSDPTLYAKIFGLYLEFFFPVEKNLSKSKTVVAEEEIPIQAQNRRQKLTERFWLIFTEFWIDLDAQGSDAVTLNHVQVLYLLIEHTHKYLYLPISMIHADTYLNSGFFDLERNIGVLRPRIFKFLLHLLDRHISNTNEATFDEVTRLWLVWIRPWRYRVEFTNTKAVKLFTPKYNGFVKDNLECYTTLFILYLERVLSSWLRCDVAYDIQDLSSRYERMKRIDDVLAVFVSSSNGLCPVLHQAEKHRKLEPASPGTLRFNVTSYVPLFDVADFELNLHNHTEQLLQKLYSRVKRSIVELNEKKTLPQIQPSTTNWFTQLFNQEDGKKAKHDKQKQLMLDKCILKAEYILSACSNLGITNSFNEASDQQPLLQHINHVAADPIHEWRPTSNEVDLNELRNTEMLRVWSQPVRSYESAALVQLMYIVSSEINDKFEKRPWFFDDDDSADVYLRSQLDTCLKATEKDDFKQVYSVFALVREDETAYVLKTASSKHESLETVLTETDTGYSLDGRLHFIDVFELLRYYQKAPYGTNTDNGLRYLLKQYPQGPSTLTESLFPVNLRCLADRNFQIRLFLVFLFLVLLMRLTSAVFVLFTFSLVGLGYLLLRLAT